MVSSLDGYQDWTVLNEDVDEPAEHDIWDETTNEWKLNIVAKVDTDAGVAHIEWVHQLKQLEAAVILSGTELTHGLLVDEAIIRNLTLQEMAELVYSKSADRRHQELTRMSEKYNVATETTT